MSPKIFARLKASLSRNSSQQDVPEYSVNDPNQSLTSPSYEEVLAQDARNTGTRRVPLVRTISEASYTPSELSTYVDEAEETGQIDSEELPAYEERPPMPLFFRNISTISVSRPQPHSMCPCAQCHRLR